jgi:hypothetical protein
MDPQLLVTALVSAGGATILVAIINAFFNRRKLSAEATQIITQAAAGTVENIMKDNAELRRELGEVKRQLEELREAQRLAEQLERAHALHEDRWRWHMERWHRYVARLLVELRAAGVRNIEEPPPPWPDLSPAGEMRH